MTSRIVSLLLISTLLFSLGCGGDISIIPTVHAATPVDPNSAFHGRYIFHSRGTGNMSEVGYIIADGKGHFTLHSMYINDGLNNSVNTAGHYTLTTSFAGTAMQGACTTTQPICSPGDYEALFVSSDGSFAKMVSMEGPGAGWSLDMQRDPGITVGDLSTCDATRGTVLNCDDGWIMPPNWK